MTRSALRAGLAVLLLATAAPPTAGQVQTLSDAAREHESARTDIKGVIADSLRLLVMEHSVRIAAQGKTRQELGGPFWRDYRRSVRSPRQWNDGDGWLVNYVGHPGHGAAAGFIWASHDPDSPAVEHGFTSEYWLSRGRASAWSAAYSLQFELGPFSEASIGNVGRNPSTTGWVDHVITPLGGFGVMIAEDALDLYIINGLERRVGSPVLRAALRVALNPARSLANVAGGRSPWHRVSRPLTRPASVSGPPPRDTAVEYPTEEGTSSQVVSAATDPAGGVWTALTFH